jgi:hypothetical protein
MTVEPTLGLPATEKGSDTAKGSEEGLITHELGHNMQGRDNISTDKLADGMGWKKGNDGKYMQQDRDGNTYSPIMSKTDHNADRWVRTDNDGHTLDANGRPVSEGGEADIISNKEMQDRAKVRPSSDYFVNPKEEFADGVANYRLNEGTRSDMLKNSPELYDQIKQMDQAEMDTAYGAGNMVRLPSGEMAPNNSDNQAQIADFEHRVIAAH